MATEHKNARRRTTAAWKKYRAECLRKKTAARHPLKVVRRKLHSSSSSSSREVRKEPLLGSRLWFQTLLRWVVGTKQPEIPRDSQELEDLLYRHAAQKVPQSLLSARHVAVFGILNTIALAAACGVHTFAARKTQG